MTRLVVIISLVLLFPLIDATEALAQNVAQVDGPGAFSCPVSGVVGDVPGLVAKHSARC